MHKSQIASRATIARRAALAGRGATPSTEPVSRNPGRRVMTPVTESGHVKKSSAAPMTKAQRDSQGNYSAWNDSTDFFTCPKWDQTVSSQRI